MGSSVHEPRRPCPSLLLPQESRGQEAVGRGLCWECGRAQRHQPLLAVEDSMPPPPQHLSPWPYPQSHCPGADEQQWCPPGGRLSWLPWAVTLPSRRALPPGLRSGLRLDSQSLFLSAQRNPWPRGSSQRHCAGREGHRSERQENGQRSARESGHTVLDGQGKGPGHTPRVPAL